MAAYSVEDLPGEKLVVFVASTTGQGEAPGNMHKFWRSLLRKSMPALSGLVTAVFGLGDSAYVKYNAAARRLTARLAALGAKVLIQGLGDDQNAGGYDAALDPFLALLWTSVREIVPVPPGCEDPPSPPPGAEIAVLSPLDRPKLELHFLPRSNPDIEAAIAEAEAAIADPLLVAQVSAAVDAALAAASGTPERHPTGQDALAEGSPARPYLATVTSRHQLTTDTTTPDGGPGQDVWHLELVYPLLYAPGDSLSVQPPNPVGAAAVACRRLGLDPTARVTLAITAGSHDACSSDDALPWWAGPWPVLAVIGGCLDLAGGCPRRYLFEILAHFSSEPREMAKLAHFAVGVAGREELWAYAGRERRTLMEVLDDFPSAAPPLAWLLQFAPRLRPRLFSIASAHAAAPGRAQIAVARVAWRTPWKRERHGLCSTWLAGPTAAPGSLLPVWPGPPSGLPVPAPTTPLLLVGPGTGLAPLRAILQHRAATGATAPAMLFFGCRREAHDYLYRDELESYATPGGPLDPARGGGLVVAFSRDGPAKRYVTHCIKDHAAQVWALLAAMGHVYVCGAAGKLATDVAEALRAVAQQEGGLSDGDATRWHVQLASSGRCWVETW